MPEADSVTCFRAVVAIAVLVRGREMSDIKLDAWPSAISGVRELGNHQVSSRGTSLEFSLVDLATQARHFFVFEKVLGFRHQLGFNIQRIGNSFLVKDSAWVQAMKSEPFLAYTLDAAQHYLFDSNDGQFEVVALREPSYHCGRDG